MSEKCKDRDFELGAFWSNSQSGTSSEIEGEHRRKKGTEKRHSMATLGPGEDFGSVLRVMRSPRRFVSRGKCDWTHDLEGVILAAINMFLSNWEVVLIKRVV